MTNLFPTIVIGLGTFGGNVVNNLRTLVFEELGVAGLPIFRFVNISTHKVDEIIPRPSNQRGDKPWEILHILGTTMSLDDTRRIVSILDENHPLHQQEPGWKEWIDDGMLRMPIQSWEAGAGNNRMVGRCCLWNNWQRETNVKTVLSNFVQRVTHPQAANDSNEVLRKYYARKTGTEPDHGTSFVQTGTPRVYIIGTLCGGTCSGTFLDLAYFFKTYRGHNLKVFGVFSVPDISTCNAPGGDRHRWAANALAALMELDFYMHNDTPYSALFPLDNEVTKSTDLPFDYVQLVSPTSRNGVVLGTEAIANDATIEELSYICASSMFFELLSGSEGVKAGIYSNYYMQFPQWRRRRQAGPGYLKGFSSFGAATAHYPKYRIAGAAACRLILEKILEWTGKTFEQDPTTQEEVIKAKSQQLPVLKQFASEWLNKAYQKSKKKLTLGTSGRGNLRQEWHAEFNAYFFPHNRPAKLSALDLRHNLENKPDGDPFSGRFLAEGLYERTLRSRLPDFQEEMLKSLKEQYNAALASVVADRSAVGAHMAADLLELKGVIDSLCGEVLNEIQGMAGSIPTGPVQTGFLDAIFREFQEVESSSAALLVGVREPVRHYYRQRLIQEYLDRLNQEHDQLEDACLGEILPDLQKDLNLYLKNSITQLLAKIDQSIQTLLRHYNELTNLELYENMVVVVSDRVKGILPDVLECKQHFRPAMWAEVFEAVQRLDPNSRSVKDLFLDPRADHKNIIERLIDQVVRKLMGLMDMRQFNIVEELIGNYSQELITMSRRSNSLIELVHSYQDVFGGRHPRLICGGKREELDTLKGHLNHNGIHEFDGVADVDSAMDHMLHFYQEEGGIALDELSAFNCMNSHYQKALDSMDLETRLLHTDRDPSKFDITMYHRFEKLHERGHGKPSVFQIATTFIPDLFFTRKPLPSGGYEMLFEWDDGGRQLDALFLSEEPEEFLWEVARSEAGCAHFEEKVLQIMEALDATEMNSRCVDIRNERIQRFGRNSDEVKKFDNAFNADFVNKKDFPGGRR